MIEDIIVKTAKKTIFMKQKTEALKKLFKEYWYDNIIHNPETVDDFLPDHSKEDFQKYIAKRTNTRYKYIMFTINPIKDVEVEVLLKQFTKYTKKKWITQHYSCFEWRGSTIDDGIHIHSKVWLHEDKNPYETKREVFNTFKNLVGNIKHINVRYSNRDYCFEDYIRGIKDGKNKENYHNDLKIRQEHHFKDTYGTPSKQGEK